MQCGAAEEDAAAMDAAWASTAGSRGGARVEGQMPPLCRTARLMMEDQGGLWGQWAAGTPTQAILSPSATSCTRGMRQDIDNDPLQCGGKVEREVVAPKD